MRRELNWALAWFCLADRTYDWCRWPKTKGNGCEIMQNFCVLTETRFVFTRTPSFHFSRLSISRFSWCCCHFCAAIKVDVRSLQAFNTSQRVRVRVECDMQTLLTRLNQNGPHSPSVTLIIRNFTFDWRVHPRSHKHTQYTRTSDAAE